MNLTVLKGLALADLPVCSWVLKVQMTFLGHLQIQDFPSEPWQIRMYLN